MPQTLALPPPGSAAAGVTLVGVGPGDPELLTLAALRALSAAHTVAYPLAAGSEPPGMAARIAAPWLHPEQRRLPLPLPMGEGAGPQRQAWHAAADRLAEAVAAGQAVALLCEGDVSLFATGSYLLLALRRRHPDCPVRLIPGITAVAAAAAAGQWPLALQQESLLIRPCPDTPQACEALLDQASSADWVLALLKLGRRWSWVRPLLERRGLLEQALFARRVGWPDQRLAPAGQVAGEAMPYFSLLLIRQGWPALLP
ncbi:MAG: precorrin-2 C(20)-methyltransferase [Synechococcaceae cyanobacterium]|nr:precorrin-2 C(20)-methyltransferase [Synechococcaceae cyanobacterium]